MHSCGTFRALTLPICIILRRSSHLPRFIYKIIAKQCLCDGARDPLLGGLNRNKPPLQRLCATSKRLQPSDSKADPLAEILVGSTHMLNASVLCSRATRSSQSEKKRTYKQQQKLWQGTISTAARRSKSGISSAILSGRPD